MHLQYLSLFLFFFENYFVVVVADCQDFVGVVNNVQHQKLIIVTRYSTARVIIIIIITINYNMGTNL